MKINKRDHGNRDRATSACPWTPAGGDVLRERAAAVPLIRQLAGPAD